MSFEKAPRGTRGLRPAPRQNAVMRVLRRWMERQHRRQGDKFHGMDILYLTTIGARTGAERQTPLTYFPDGARAWVVVASQMGAATHPAWYHNIAAHPDQVWIETGGRRFHVTPEQLDGERRAAMWQRIVTDWPRYAGYQAKTDRVLPVLRFTPVTADADPGV